MAGGSVWELLSYSVEILALLLKKDLIKPNNLARFDVDWKKMLG